MTWDQDNSAFIQRTEEEITVALSFCNPGHPCISCGIKHAAEAQNKWTVPEDGFLVKGDAEYHTRDVIYVRPLLDDTDVYILGQITQIHPPASGAKQPTVDIRVYQRFDLVARGQNKHNFGNQCYDEVKFGVYVLFSIANIITAASLQK